MAEVYRFPNGFAWEARQTHLALRHANLTPKIGVDGGETVISLPDSEVACLRMMQRAQPERFGNCPDCPNDSPEDTASHGDGYDDHFEEDGN